MSKYSLIFYIGLYNILMTLTAGAITGFGTNVDILTGATPFEPTVLGFLSSVFTAVGFFFKLVFFQVEGLPAIIPLLIFYPINIVGFLVLIALIRGTD